MKYSILALICAVQMLQAPAAFAIGENATIAKFARFKSLNAERAALNMSEISRIYGMRGNQSIWFDYYGQSNGLLEAYFRHLGTARDVTQANRNTWIPIVSDYYNDFNEDTWVTLEFAATQSLLIYLNGRGFNDYATLNAAINGGADTFRNYLRNPGAFSQPQQPQPLPDSGSIIVTPQQPYYPTPQAPSIVVPDVQVQDVIGYSVARYETDPTQEDINIVYQGTAQGFWLDYSSRPNAMAATLKRILRSASEHGLNPDDYWDQNLENLYRSSAGLEFENKATYALVRYANNLSRGRISGKSVDEKGLQFTIKKLDQNDLQALSAVLQSGEEALVGTLERLAPRFPQYTQLKSNLKRLMQIRNAGMWKRIADPGKALRRGDNHPTIGLVKTRLSLLGYAAGTGNIYDDQYDRAVKTYLAANGLPGTIDYRFWNGLNKSVEDRIELIKINMEKIRWIPRDGRQRYVFINLAAQEFRLVDGGQTTMKMRTINGRADRQTPSMMQQIRNIILNPTWTVPPSIAMKDKMPLIKQNPNYLKDHNMYILDASNRTYIPTLDGLDMNKFTDSSKTTRYYFVQGPGNGNALGVVKFPLNNLDGTINADDIYLHDTNERNLFPDAIRYKSSGCIRLQMPLEFAAELLRDKNMTLDDIRFQVPWDNPAQIVPQDQTNKVVNLTKAVPVYILYLTAEQTDEGGMRFFEDTYGLDAKISDALKGKFTPESAERKSMTFSP